VPLNIRTIKIKDSFARILPSHIIAAFQNKWALVTKEKMASPLDHDPKFPHYWSEHPRDKVFGANTNAVSLGSSLEEIRRPVGSTAISTDLHSLLSHGGL
jgi:hypothetical protein